MSNHNEVARFYADNMFHGYVEGMKMDKNSLILDLGTYKGYTTRLLSTLYGCTIYTFEPMIPFYNEAVKECAAHANITVLPYGLGNSNYEFLMNNSGDATSMFSTIDPATAVTCKVRDFFEFLREHNMNTIDLLHINIEGAEYDLLDYIFAAEFHVQIRYLIIQFHYQSAENDEKIKRYTDILSKTHTCEYNYNYVWTKWTLRGD
jgi:FkbM family methyltransferase